MLQALKVHASKPASEVINEYSWKVDFLKGMLQAEKLTTSSEKALANQFLAPGRVPTTARERVPATKTVHLQSRARYTSEMRSELLGTVVLLPWSLGNPWLAGSQTHNTDSAGLEGQLPGQDMYPCCPVASMPSLTPTGPSPARENVTKGASPNYTWRKSQDRGSGPQRK
ncbi:hypothetical protein P7K49_033546 [Saguinus oedipus]|uniref:Vesicle transport protein USE1 n=1 Tax=Saguinus oedipus TaxID=9490 RepID=A0ABQ9TSM9_SAGOE|nr:hypothetical protein P7K49_033546 [Saguinus oedipus]